MCRDLVLSLRLSLVTIVGMIGHTKACLIIDEQWDGRSRFDIIEFLFSLSVCLIERVLQEPVHCSFIHRWIFALLARLLQQDPSLDLLLR